SKHVEEHGTSVVNQTALAEWEAVLTDLERDPLSTADRLDWTAKLELLEGYRGRHSLKWLDPRLRMLDLQYHDIDPERSLYRKLADAGRMRRLFTEDEVARAAVEPPEGTRAWFRGRCVDKYRDAIVAANWDSLIFDAGEEALKRVPMMDPLRGTRELTAELLERSPDASDLIQALEGDNRR
ncbi:MAG TPA: proteasome accessory factor PafA2 family protein, partial [Acidimicrobiia bacterium]|nr:proteasome accessory factor PafA2 family protein [Acidimicrobiia bacterium]